MAYARVNETGCCIDGGRIRVRLDMYLEAGDPGYDEHHVYVPDETSAEFAAGYKGKLTADGRPADPDEFLAWLKSLPHVWQDNPFVSHFVYVDQETTEGDLNKLAASALDEFVRGRKAGQTPVQTWASRKRERPVAKVLSVEQQEQAMAKLDAVRTLAEMKLGGIDASSEKGEEWHTR
jgi:hypothetical protein